MEETQPEPQNDSQTSIDEKRFSLMRISKTILAWLRKRLPPAIQTKKPTTDTQPDASAPAAIDLNQLLTNVSSIIEEINKRNKPLTFLQRLNRLVSEVFSIKGITIAVTLLVGFQVAAKLFSNKDTIEINDFEVGSDLSKLGYTPHGIDSLLSDKLYRIYENAGSQTYLKGIKIVRPDLPSLEKSPEIEIPETHTSLNYVIQSIAEQFGYSRNRVSGEILSSNGKTFHLELRSNIQNHLDVYQVDKDNMDDLLLDAAMHICLLTKPLVLAAYLAGNNDIESAKALISWNSQQPNDDLWSYYIHGIKTRENDPWAHCLLGNILLWEKKYEQSLAELDKAASLDTNQTLAGLLYDLKICTLDEMRRNVPQSPESEKHLEQLIDENFEKATKTKNNLAYACYLYGLSFVERDRAKSIDYLARAVASDPSMGLAHYGLGYAYEYGPNPQHDEAIREYKITTMLNPTWPGPLSNLGLVYSSQGRYSEAADAMKVAVKLSPSDDNYRTNLAFALSNDAVRDYDGAIEQCNRILEHDARNSAVHNLLGFCYEYKIHPDYKKAMEEYRTAINIKPTEAEYHLYLAHLAVSLKLDSVADNEFKAGLTIDSSAYKEHLSYANFLASVHNNAKAIAECNIVQKSTDPDLVRQAKELVVKLHLKTASIRVDPH